MAGSSSKAAEHWLTHFIGAGENTLNVRMPVSQKNVTLTFRGELTRVVFLDGVMGYERGTGTTWLKLCKQADIVLDIGAHVGLFSLLAADANEASEVYAFEPLPENFEILCGNIQACGFKSRVRPFPIALSDKEGSSHLLVRGSSGSTLSEGFWEDSD